MKTNIRTIPINLNPAHPRGAVRSSAERWSATCRIGALAASLVLAAALRAQASDGTLVSWGYDGAGQVSGTPTNGTFSAVSAGELHSVGLRTDGTLVSWGYDGAGQVSGTPAGTFSAVDAGGYHGVAIKGASCGTPLVTITGPAGGSVYPANTAVTFTGTFDSANGPQTAKWIIDGNAMSATANESTHTVSVNTTLGGGSIVIHK